MVMHPCVWIWYVCSSQFFFCKPFGKHCRKYLTWTAICSSSFVDDSKNLLHFLHALVNPISWYFLWILRCLLWANLLEHVWHFKSLTVFLSVIICILLYILDLKDLSHISHRKVLSAECTSMCCLKLPFSLNSFPHSLHLWSTSFVTTITQECFVCSERDYEIHKHSLTDEI